MKVNKGLLRKKAYRLRLSNDDLSLTGFTMLEMMISVAIMGLLLLLILPNFIGSRDRMYKDICIDNLRAIHTAKEFYKNEHNKNTGDACIAADIDPYIKGGTAGLYCPIDPTRNFSNSYLINPIGTSTPPTCRIRPNGRNGIPGDDDDHRITP